MSGGWRAALGLCDGADAEVLAFSDLHDHASEYAATYVENKGVTVVDANPLRLIGREHPVSVSVFPGKMGAMLRALRRGLREGAPAPDVKRHGHRPNNEQSRASKRHRATRLHNVQSREADVVRRMLLADGARTPGGRSSRRRPARPRPAAHTSMWRAAGAALRGCARQGKGAAADGGLDALYTVETSVAGWDVAAQHSGGGDPADAGWLLSAARAGLCAGPLCVDARGVWSTMPRDPDDDHGGEIFEAVASAGRFSASIEVSEPGADGGGAAAGPAARAAASVREAGVAATVHSAGLLPSWAGVWHAGAEGGAAAGLRGGGVRGRREAAEGDALWRGGVAAVTGAVTCARAELEDGSAGCDVAWSASVELPNDVAFGALLSSEQSGCGCGVPLPPTPLWHDGLLRVQYCCPVDGDAPEQVGLALSWTHARYCAEVCCQLTWKQRSSMRPYPHFSPQLWFKLDLDPTNNADDSAGSARMGSDFMLVGGNNAAGA